MDPTQQKALNALEQYILLSKSATSPRAAVDLITQATSAPNTFVFAELLQTPNIRALRTAPEDQAQYLTLLEIFAWGTWRDYECLFLSHLPPSSHLPYPLTTPTQESKLTPPPHSNTQPSPPLNPPVPQTPPTNPPHPRRHTHHALLPLPLLRALPLHRPRP